MLYVVFRGKAKSMLIELLFVVAIIAVLLSVIMTALNAAKRQSSGAVCLSNERRLSTSWHLFAGDRPLNSTHPRKGLEAVNNPTAHKKPPVAEGGT
jgi:hypothetical protein